MHDYIINIASAGHHFAKVELPCHDDQGALLALAIFRSKMGNGFDITLTKWTKPVGTKLETDYERAIQRMMKEMGWDRARAELEYESDPAQRF